MVKKKQSGKEAKVRVKVGKLKLNRETVKDLSGSEAKRVKGGGGALTAESPSVNGYTCGADQQGKIKFNEQAGKIKFNE